VSEREHTVGRRARGWKSWVFEFFLIFFSVSLSYLVDSYRDHLADRRRGAKYAADMITDIRSDTATLRESIGRLSIARDNVARFLALVADPRPDTIPTGALYWYGLWCGYGPSFDADDATFETMKASGALQLFDYGGVGRYVAQYYQSVSAARGGIARDEVIYAQAWELHARIFDFHVNSAANAVAQANYTSFSQARIDDFVSTRPPLLSRDPGLMSQHAEMCRSRFFDRRVNELERALERADTALVRLEGEFS
jgi:hypothetical protein